MSKPVTVDGMLFHSVKDACEFYNIPYASVTRELQMHPRTAEDIIKKKINDTNPKKMAAVTYKGVDYASIPEAAKALGLDVETIYHLRWYSRLTYEEALDELMTRRAQKENEKCSTRGGRHNIKSVTVNGITYESFQAACDALKINRGSVSNYRYTTGCTHEEAILHFVSDDNTRRPRQGCAVEYKGVRYASIKEMCKQLGISLQGFDHYRRRHNTSIEETIDMYLSGKIRKGYYDRGDGPSKKVEVPKTLPESIVEDTTEYEDTIPDVIETDLQKWRMSSRIGKRALVGASDAIGYSKWVMDSRTKLTESFEIFPDKERMPWLSFKSIAEVIEKADVDEEELAYLIYVCGHDAMASIVICRENTESDSAAQADEIDKLKKEIKSLKSEINSQYCHECGERISEEFLKTHPGTKYCINCYDKHI